MLLPICSMFFHGFNLRRVAVFRTGRTRHGNSKDRTGNVGRAIARNGDQEQTGFGQWFRGLTEPCGSPVTLVDVTLQERHRDELIALLDKPDGTEAAAYVLFGTATVDSDPWERTRRLRLTSFDILPVPEEDLVSASRSHVTWSTRSFVRLCQQAKEADLVPGIVHSHPGGYSGFSNQDNENERELFQLVQNRNGEGSSLTSLVLMGGTDFRARLWLSITDPIDSQVVQSVGRKVVRHEFLERHGDNEILGRQALAFGPALNAQLKQLRVGIVGCGGTGSATAMLLAKVGCWGDRTV